LRKKFTGLSPKEHVSQGSSNSSGIQILEIAEDEEDQVFNTGRKFEDLEKAGMNLDEVELSGDSSDDDDNLQIGGAKTQAEMELYL